jgi:hypothetical protein
MTSFLTGFIKGVNETPLGFFAPAIVLWRVLVDGSEKVIAYRGSE